MPRDKAMAAYSNMQEFQQRVGHSGAALEVLITKRLNSSASQLVPASGRDEGSVPRIAISDTAGDRLSGLKDASVSIDVPAPHDEPVTVKNVVGILPGSDPLLKKTYVLVTAHYDHIGTTETAGRMANPESTPNPNDHIYNGANDDGSGTVSVIEIARALAKAHVRPKRTLVFMTFFGEERGELGSEYYVAHPIFAISKTVADFNLEQVGRTDELDSGKIVKRLNSLSVTGFDYSDVTGYLIRAGKQLGVRVYKDDQASDQYFRQSDNAAFADAGVPAHSITVAFDYPDYHGLGDEWRKIDYDNMARVDRVIALAAFETANSRKAPAWSAQNPKAVAFRQAREKQLSEAH
jgi:Zn-dependent M28 family amino/carboxypeptidase